MFKILIKKEIISLFSSIYSVFFALLLFVMSGLFLWLFPGTFNIMDKGYATLDSFFNLWSLLLLVLIPSLTMKSFSSEKMNKRLDLQLSRPISILKIYLSKCIAIFVFLLLIVICSGVYLYTVYQLGSPVGNIDLGIVYTSYVGLLLILAVFVFFGVLASSISRYSILGFALGLFFNFSLFYGFDLLSSISSNVVINKLLKDWSLNIQFDDIRRGVFSLKYFVLIVSYILLACAFSTLILATGLRSKERKNVLWIFLLVTLINGISIMGISPEKYFDFTQDKRYTLSSATKKILSEAAIKNTEIEVNLYLTTNINYSFERLRDAVINLISDFNKEAKGNIHLKSKDPITMNINTDDIPSTMLGRNMPPITLNEKSRDGKISQQLIYPYAEVICNNDTLMVSLLKQVQGYTAEQNLNISAESLEFEFIDAINLLINRQEQHIAFIEGHDEISRAYLYNAEEDLAKYFFVNRGEIGSDISILDNFKVVIIAGPKTKFTESEKYILDQYLMRGGRILWLIDGAIISDNDLLQKGYSAGVRNETNLDDLLFAYGARINPDLLQDTYCSEILLNNGQNSQSVTAPWYYSPILIPSLKNPITGNIGDIKSQYVSSIDILKTNQNIKKEVLLTTAQNSRRIELPAVVDFDFQTVSQEKTKFKDSFLPVAISMEGNFKSAFKNRPIPDGLYSDQSYKTMEQSLPTKMIVVSTSDLITNDLIGKGKDTQIVPMGYDRLSGRMYGNRDFILNAVHWLASDKEWMSLRTKEHKLTLLNKESILRYRDIYSVVNIILPVLFVFLVWLGVFFYRKNRYTK